MNTAWQPKKLAWRIAKFIVNVVLFPLRLWLSFRRSMTTTSVTLLLMSIVSLNIVWGYPWVGMFAACVAISVVGGLANRLFSPSIRVDVRLPLSVPATEAFQSQIHLTNLRRLPAMDLRVGFDTVTYRRFDQIESRLDTGESLPDVVTQQLIPVSLIRSRSHEIVSTSLRYTRRGIHTLPRVTIESSFPFYLFRTIRRVKLQTQIAITPAPLVSSQASLAQSMMKSIDQLTPKSAAGDSLEYTGSREYQEGVQVRRWDFGSWARLGKPIVREYQASALQTAWLIVDTSADRATPKTAADEGIERVLSCAAAAIPEWLQRSIRLRMYVASESPDELISESVSSSVTDIEPLLIRLAGANAVDPKIADERVLRMVEGAGNKPVMILTSRLQLPSVLLSRVRCQVVCCAASANESLKAANSNSGRTRRAVLDPT